MAFIRARACVLGQKNATSHSWKDIFTHDTTTPQCYQAPFVDPNLPLILINMRDLESESEELLESEPEEEDEDEDESESESESELSEFELEESEESDSSELASSLRKASWSVS